MLATGSIPRPGLPDRRGDRDRDRVALRCAALRCTVRGTHKRDFLGQTPTERRFEIQQIHIYRVQDGRIAEHWACRDDVAMFHQLGLTG
jgi:predicted ester cyclase